MMALEFIAATGYMQPRRLSNGMATTTTRVASSRKTPKPCHVELTTWRSSAQQFATMIAHERNQHGHQPRVILAGHSFGGWWVSRLAAELHEFGVNVDHLFLADAVDREGKDGRQITVTPNVVNLYCYRQAHALGPKGSQVIFDRNFTTLVRDVHLDSRRHRQVDETPEFQRLIFEAATAPIAA